MEDLTRINVFLNDGEQEYKFVNGGSFVSRDKQDEMLDIIKSRKDMDYLSISGSLPPGISPEYYEEILSICNDKSVKVILDVSSPKLKELLRFRPYLIKPNDEEIAEIFGIVMKSDKISVGIYSNFSYFGHWFLQRYCIVKQRKNKYGMLQKRLC